MNTSITLLRHGETEWNALGKFQGCRDISLSTQGIKQAQYLYKRFNNKFDFIYTSPLNRARQTAEIICKNSDDSPIVSSQLREINFGEWEGLTIKEIEANFPEKLIKWRNDELNGPMCGGELSLKKASIRSVNAILEIAKKHQGKNVIIVAHGGIIKAGLIGIFDLKMNMYHKMVLGNTAVCKITFDDDFSPKLITLNDTNHLPDDFIMKSSV